MNYPAFALIFVLLLLAIYGFVIYLELKKDLQETRAYIAKKGNEFLKLEHKINLDYKKMTETNNNSVAIYNKTIDVYKEIIAINKKELKENIDEKEQSA